MTCIEKPSAIKVPGAAFYRAAVSIDAPQGRLRTNILPLGHFDTKYQAVRAARTYLQAVDPRKDE